MEKEESVRVLGVRQRIEAADADLSGSTFRGVKLAEASFQDANLTGAVVTDCNLAGVRIENASLSGIQICNASLKGAALTDCATEAMTIDGVLVSEMMAAYRAAHPRKS
jgi:uncharacterized protein YjbI with pentapeptide repeats